MRFEKWISNNWFCYGLIAFLTLAVWGRSVGFDFVWDDELFIVDNKSVYSLKNIPSMFTEETAQSSLPGEAKVFRPLRTALYAILTAIPGKGAPQPWIFHLANVLWHTVAACLFFLVAKRFFEKQSSDSSQLPRSAALLLALGFAVHPVTSEVVCWAKSMDDIMAAVFSLATVATVLKWDGRERAGYLAALGFFLLAVYSKESAVPLVLPLFLIFHQVHRLSWKENFLRSTGFAAVAIIYMAHRHWIIGQMSQCPPLSGSYGQTLIDMFPVVGKYLRLLLGIPPFCIDYAYMKGHHRFFSIDVLAGVFLAALFIGLMVWLWRRHWLAAFGLIWLGAFLLPVSNLLPMMQYMAERFLYLPLLGFLLAICVLIARRPRVGALVGITLIMIWSWLAWSRCGIWRDPLTLFVSTSQESPPNLRVEKNAVIAIFKLPNMRPFLPDFPQTHKLNIAQQISPEHLAPVLRTLEEARRLYPGNEKILTVLAFAKSREGKPQEAVAIADLVAHQCPDDAQLWANLAALSLNVTNVDRARQASDMALKLDTNNIDALRISARLYLEAGDKESAAPALRRLEEIDPQNPNYRGKKSGAEKNNSREKNNVSR